MSLIRSYVRRHHVGLLALFVALGGTAYAGTQLEKNEVRSRNIAPGQVKRSDIARNAVNSRKVADGSLLRGDFAAGQLPAGTTGAAGATGATGPTGPAGLTSSKGVSASDSIQAPSCVDTVLRTRSVTVAEPSKMLAISQTRAMRGAAGQVAALVITARDGGTEVARVERIHEELDPGENQLTAVGLLKDNTGGEHTFAPGTYTLQLEVEMAGVCSPSNATMNWTTLDHVVLGAG